MSASFPADEPFCYVTTKGRRTGRDHTIEIWFGADASTIYLMSGGGRRADWVRNLLADPSVTVRFGGPALEGTARLVSDAAEDAAAHRLLAGKYQGWREGAPLSEWARTALVVAIDLDARTRP
ncbi:MAG: nitroreductase family deazaflavin-dependent oxidoreductase [Actinomycetota bacterium]